MSDSCSLLVQKDGGYVAKHRPFGMDPIHLDVETSKIVCEMCQKSRYIVVNKVLLFIDFFVVMSHLL